MVDNEDDFRLVKRTSSGEARCDVGGPGSVRLAGETDKIIDIMFSVADLVTPFSLTITFHYWVKHPPHACA